MVASLLTVLSCSINGYHPYAEDGGVYLAGVKRLLYPALYPHGSAFVMEHLRFSLFAPLVAGLVRGSHVGLTTVLFAMYVASIWMTLFAGWHLAARCYESRAARGGAMMLLAVWIGLPLAGTALMLMDPYVSARSISTPCTLLALVGMLDVLQGEGTQRWRGLALCCGALLVAGVLHPLMAAYGLGFVLLLAAISVRQAGMRAVGTVGLCLLAMGIAWMVQETAAPESSAYLGVVMTRTYWFVGRWTWYEQFGLVAPLLILGVAGVRWRRVEGYRVGRAQLVRALLARAAVVSGAAAMLVATVFARAELATHVVARLQPLRMFQMVYVVMIVVVGAALGERVLRRNTTRWAVAMVLLGGPMLLAEWKTFPDSTHIELPGRAPTNAWEQAFEWIRDQTPVDALFAIDARYIDAPGEDAQTFRAIAERSVLPDSAKDGGEVSIMPSLTAAWVQGVTAQRRLNEASDAERESRLKPLGVQWLVLERGATTEFACAYENAAVKVCRLP